MEQETTLSNQVSTKKLYKDRQVWTGTFLGGPLVAGYLIAQNFKAFGDKEKARNTWIVTIVGTIIIFSIAFFAPYIEKVPTFFFALVYTSIAYTLMRLYQEEKIKHYLETGGQIHSWWRTIGTSLVGLLATLVLTIGTSLIVDYASNRNIVSKTYDGQKNEIAFDKNNLSEVEVDKIAAALKANNFFNDEQQTIIDAKKVGDAYEITVYCNDIIKSSPEAVGYFRALRNDLQKTFPVNKIIFNLVIGTPDNIIERLE